jgi:mannan endo-1,4-beta-mannosidase
MPASMKALVTAGVVLGVCASICGAASADDFVQVRGNHFVVGDAPFVFAGANIDPLHGQIQRAALDAVMNAVREDNLTVLRVWALGEGPVDAPARDRDYVLFRVGQDGYIEDAYKALDLTLMAAHARGLRVMLTLCNAWPDFGGVRQYLAWAGLPERGGDAVDRFYRDERVRAALYAHIDRLLERVNTGNGVRYADDPTIFAWEIMNESQVNSDAGAEARREFITQVSAHIRARDPHHLVSAGVIGYGTRTQRAEWRTVCALPAVDFCDAHLYPQYADRVDDVQGLLARVDDRVQLAHFVVGKPIIFGEFGFDTREDHALWRGVRRERWFDRLLGQFARDRVDGMMVWIYQPWTGHPRDFGIYVDRGDTDDVRATMRRYADRLATRDQLPENPRLGATRGDAMLYPAYVSQHGRGAPRVERDASGLTVHLPPMRYDRARWERAGTWDGGPLDQAYGADDGAFEWDFTLPASVARKPRRLRVRARISSEHSGADAPPDEWSIVTVSLDGAELGAWRAIPDDELGAIERLELDDPEVLARLTPGRHRLRLAVPRGPHAHGLCVYGAIPQARAPELERTKVEQTDVELRLEW